MQGNTDMASMHAANTASASLLQHAKTVQDTAATLGFDWSEMDGVWDKLSEEVQELREAASPADQAEELGDLMFMLVNLARHLDIDAEMALAQATAKFERRFAAVCKTMAEARVAMRPENIAHMEKAWQQAKESEGDAPASSPR